MCYVWIISLAILRNTLGTVAFKISTFLKKITLLFIPLFILLLVYIDLEVGCEYQQPKGRKIYTRKISS